MPITQQMLRDGLHSEPDYDNPRCIKCKYYTQTHSPFVAPILDGPVLFVLGFPSMQDKGQVSLNSVEWLMIQKEIVEPLAIDSPSFATIVQCHPVKKKTVGKTAATMCSPFLLHAMHKKIPVEDRRIIAMGADAMHTLVSYSISMDDALGRVFDTVHGKVLVTYSIREYFHELKADQVLSVGVLDVIRNHVQQFVIDTPWHVWPTYKEVI